MRKIFACMDIGSHSTKLLIMEELKDKFIVLSRFIVKSKGIKKGIIVDEEEALLTVKKIIGMAQDDLHVPIQSLLLVIPSDNVEFSMTEGNIDISGSTITKTEITKVLQVAMKDKQDEQRVLVSVNPVFYSVDDQDNLKDVRGLVGNKLSVKAVVSSIPRSVAYPFFSLFKKLGIELIDVELSLVGDYFAAGSSFLDKEVVAVVNIGYDKCDVGIFNKGILIRSEKLDVGSRLIDKDIAFNYNLERKKCRYLKETFAVCNTRYADVGEVVHIKDKEEKEIIINQLKLSELVEMRVLEILKLAKKQITLLTNREIRYIIVSGGISEIAGFEYTLENVYGRSGILLNTSLMGVRSNSYSSCFGFIQCFARKMELQNKEYTMISGEALDNIAKNKNKTASESGLSGILSYFTGNKED